MRTYQLARTKMKTTLMHALNFTEKDQTLNEDYSKIIRCQVMKIWMIIFFPFISFINGNNYESCNFFKSDIILFMCY